MTRKNPVPPPTDDKQLPQVPADSEGSNAVEHEPDLKAEPISDGHHKYIRRSPYTAGND